MANSKEEAILHFQAMMTPELAVSHRREKHLNEPLPPPEEAKKMIEDTIQVLQ
jgi:hypothetical protein